MPKEDLKMSDLAGAKPYYNDIHFDISGIMHKYPKAVYELDRVLFGKDQTHVNTPTQTMNGWYDINLLPYYKYRLETTPVFHSDEVISEFVGNLEKLLIDLTDVFLENAVTPTDWTPAPEDDIHDAVSHPSYYDLPSGMESKDVIRAALGDEGYEIWCQGTSLKYLFRYPNKENPVMDLNKAKQYIDFILDLRQEDLSDVED